MSSIDEKRVFEPDTDPLTAYVASELGVAAVALVGDRVGTVDLQHRAAAADVAAADGRVAIATDEDVRRLRAGRFEPLGFGPATAIGFAERLVAAAPDGRIARYDGDEWTTVGTIDDGVRAIDGDLAASESGVYRLADDGPRHVGLAAVRDVAAAGTPHAATAEGLYALGNGWMDVLRGEFRTVSIDDRTAKPGRLGRAHAATSETLYEHGEGEWRPCDLPVDDAVVGVDHGSATYAVTLGGVFLADAGDGWRDHPTGLRAVTGIAVS